MTFLCNDPFYAIQLEVYPKVVAMILQLRQPFAILFIKIFSENLQWASFT